jgi:hypothetical protein
MIGSLATYITKLGEKEKKKKKEKRKKKHAHML